MRYVSLFSGIEAASCAWEGLGFEPVAFSEIEPFPCAVLEERFPEVPNLGDVTRIDWSDYAGSVDLVVGGSPCQSFSVAGGREGLDGESGLMWEYVRAVQELRPSWLLWENVPGALSSRTRDAAKGDDFRCLLSALDDLGYGLAWRVLDAQYFGVAQRRRRVFVVGCLGDPWRAAEVLLESDCLRWDTPSGREKRQELAALPAGGAGGGCLTPWDTQTNRVYSEHGPFCALQSRGSAGMDRQAVCYDTTQITSPQNGCNPQFGDPCHPLAARQHPPLLCDRSEAKYVVRRLMPVECERLQGFPDGWTDIEFKGEPASDAARYKALGNSMAVPVMLWIGRRIQLAGSPEGCPHSKSQLDGKKAYCSLWEKWTNCLEVGHCIYETNERKEDHASD